MKTPTTRPTLPPLSPSALLYLNRRLSPAAVLYLAKAMAAAKAARS